MQDAEIMRKDATMKDVQDVSQVVIGYGVSRLQFAFQT